MFVMSEGAGLIVVFALIFCILLLGINVMLPDEDDTKKDKRH